MKIRYDSAGVFPRPFRSTLALLWLTACSSAQEAPRVQLALGSAQMASEAVHTNLGYDIELSEARLALADLRFTALGDAQARKGSRWVQPIHDLLIPSAHAHPGHGSAGEVNGELLGHFVVSFGAESEPVGLATLTVGAYEAGVFTFGRASEGDGLAAGDPILGHTAILTGRASREGQETRFAALVDSPEGRELTGVPFEAEVSDSARASLALELAPTDPYEGDTLFDNIDFHALADSEGVLELSEAAEDPPVAEAYFTLRRALLTHDHYGLRYLALGSTEER